ncbi:RhuM family protein [Bacteroides sp.]
MQKETTIRNIQIVQQKGERDVKYSPIFYNFAIIIVGYRVNSYQTIQFSIWTTRILKKFIVKPLMSTRNLNSYKIVNIHLILTSN